MKGQFRRSLRCVGELLDFVDVFARENNLGSRTTFAVRLVVEELFANFVRHNTGGREQIEVSLKMDAGLLTLKLWDFDVEPFDVRGSGPVDIGLPLSERKAGGLGLHFVRSYFDDLSYTHSKGTVCVTATKEVGRPDV